MSSEENGTRNVEHAQVVDIAGAMIYELQKYQNDPDRYKNTLQLIADFDVKKLPLSQSQQLYDALREVSISSADDPDGTYGVLLERVKNNLMRRIEDNETIERERVARWKAEREQFSAAMAARDAADRKALDHVREAQLADKRDRAQVIPPEIMPTQVVTVFKKPQKPPSAWQRFKGLFGKK